MHPFALSEEQIKLVSGGSIAGGTINDPLTPITPIAIAPVGTHLPVGDSTQAIGEEGGTWWPGPNPVELV